MENKENSVEVTAEVKAPQTPMLALAINPAAAIEALSSTELAPEQLNFILRAAAEIGLRALSPRMGNNVEMMVFQAAKAVVQDDAQQEERATVMNLIGAAMQVMVKEIVELGVEIPPEAVYDVKVTYESENIELEAYEVEEVKPNIDLIAKAPMDFTTLGVIDTVQMLVEKVGITDRDEFNKRWIAICSDVLARPNYHLNDASRAIAGIWEIIVKERHAALDLGEGEVDSTVLFTLEETMRLNKLIFDLVGMTSNTVRTVAEAHNEQVQELVAKGVQIAVQIGYTPGELAKDDLFEVKLNAISYPEPEAQTPAEDAPAVDTTAESELPEQEIGADSVPTGEVEAEAEAEVK